VRFSRRDIGLIDFHLSTRKSAVGIAAFALVGAPGFSLSASLFALAGSIGSLYEGESGRRIAIDLAIVALRLPATFSREVFVRELNAVRGHLARRLAPAAQPAVPLPLPRVPLPKAPVVPALIPG